MTYLCYIDCSALSVSHMEPLAAQDLADALRESERLLAQHSSGYAARIFKGDRHLVTIRAQPRHHAVEPRRPSLRGGLATQPFSAAALKSDPRSVIQ